MSKTDHFGSEAGASNNCEEEFVVRQTSELRTVSWFNFVAEWTPKVIAFVSICVFVVSLSVHFNYVSQNHQLNFKSVKSTTSTSSASSSSFGSSFIIQRVGYSSLPYFGSESSATKSYMVLEKYDSIIEPYVDSTIDYLGDYDDVDYLKYEISYKDNGKFFSSGHIYLGDTDRSNLLNIPCEPYSEFNVNVVIRKDKTDTAEVDLTVVCMYVRREIRELTSDDLNATIYAMHTLWSMDESEGQEKYGSDFHGSKWFASMHDFNAGWKDADHFHEGLGFLPQHIKMTNIFEKALQSVNPAVSMFYWDFTYDHAEGLTLTDSPMFQDSTFGELRGPVDSYWGWTYRNDSLYRAQISSGLWRKTKVDDTVFEDLKNGFGYMRGPWNMNPSQYISRFTNPDGEVPSCLTYYNWLSETGFSNYMQQSGYGPHASTHGTVGGVYGCDMMDSLREAGLIDATAQLEVCSKWGFYIKELYRAEFIVPKDDCTAGSKLDYDTVSCGFTCDDDQLDDMVTFMKESLTLKNYVAEDTDDDDWAAWREFVCTGDGYRIFVGDHLESASPNDPSFWPIHPTQDRLLQLKYMTGGFDDYTWPTSTSSRASDYVCNHAKCYNYKSYGGQKDYFDFCCFGHFENDQMLDFTSGDRTKSYGPTNKEILDAVNPAEDSYSVPYVYSHFDWDHCTQDFDGLVDMLSAKMLTKRK